MGGFAQLAFTRLRLETLEGTRLPQAVLDVGGEVRDPEHLLAFDRRFASFNRVDLMSNWLSLEPLPETYVIVSF